MINRRVLDLLFTILDTLKPQSSIRCSLSCGVQPLLLVETCRRRFTSGINWKSKFTDPLTHSPLTFSYSLHSMTLVPLTFLSLEIPLFIVAPCYQARSPDL